METICLTILPPTKSDLRAGVYCSIVRDYLQKEYYPLEEKRRIYAESLAGRCPFRCNCFLFRETLKSIPYQLPLF